MLVKDKDVFGSGSKRIIQKGDLTAHDEMEVLGKFWVLEDYGGTTMYATKVPCRMCADDIV